MYVRHCADILNFSEIIHGYSSVCKIAVNLCMLLCLRDSIEVLSCNTLQILFSENLYFLVTNVFSVSKLILWYLNMPYIDLATRLKLESNC